MDKEYYLFVEGKKVVVSKEVYLAYHSELNKEKYQIRRDRLNNCFFFFFFFKQKTAYEIASCLVGSEMCIRDRDLIESLFYKEETIREVAAKLNISHPAVIKRRNKVLEKLKEMLEDF